MSKIAVPARRPAVFPLKPSYAQRRGQRLLRAAAIGAIACGPVFWSADAFGATNSWNTDLSSLWTGSTNWSLGHIPTTGEDALISRPSANPTITLSSGSHSINSLTSNELFVFSGGTLSLAAASQLNDAATLSGGTLGGAGTVTLFGSAGTWSGGTFTGGGTTSVGASTTLNMVPGPEVNLVNRTMVNHGTINYSGSSPTVYFTFGTLSNLAGATFNASTSGQVFFDVRESDSTNVFHNAGTINKSGTGAFIINPQIPFDNTGTVNVLGGTLSVGTTSQISGDQLAGGTWSVSNNAALVLGSVLGSIGSGASVKLDGANSSFADINFISTVDGTFTITNGRVFDPSGPMTVSGLVTVGQASVLKVHDPLVNFGKIDLNAALIDDYSGPSPLSDIRSQIITGFAGGSWTGGQITSSSAAAVAANSGNSHKTGLGYANAASIGIVGSGTFAGQSVDDTSVLVLYTFYGDANLDGAVNSADFSRLAANFGQSGKFWSDGDYNYDGIVNSLDFNALASNFGQGPAPSAPVGGPSLGQTVPEPAGLGLVSLAMMGLSRRRRIPSLA